MVSSLLRNLFIHLFGVVEAWHFNRRGLSGEHAVLQLHLGVRCTRREVCVESHRFEPIVALQGVRILVSQDHSLVLLQLLGGKVDSHVHGVIEDLQVVQLVHFVDILVVVGILKHLGG